MPEPTNVSALARSAESPTALRTREPEPEIRLTNPTKASEAAGFNIRSIRETGGAGRSPLLTAFGTPRGIAVLYLWREVLGPLALALLLSFFLSSGMVCLRRW